MDQRELDLTREWPRLTAALNDKGYPPGFFSWLGDNPHVYRRFREMARRMARRKKHYSARSIIEVIRWETDLHDSDKHFKINGNWVPGLARLFMHEYPKHKGFFRCRNQQGLDV